MDEFIRVYLLKLLVVLAALIFGSAGYRVGKLAVKYLNTAIKQEIAQSAVLYVEQVYMTIHGEEKTDEALKVAQTLLAKMGLKFDAAEMRMLIKAAVCAFNDGFNKGKENDSAALPSDQEADTDPLSDVLKEMPMHPATFDEKDASGLPEE